MNKAINPIKEVMKKRIGAMTFKKPMYLGDILTAIGYVGKANAVRLIDVIKEMVKEGTLIETIGKYNFEQYTKAQPIEQYKDSTTRKDKCCVIVLHRQQDNKTTMI